MRTRLPKLILLLVAVTVAGSFIVAPHEAHAACSLNPLTYSWSDCVDSFTAWIFNVILQGIAVLWLTLAGTLLNAALVITLNMNQVVNSVPIIDSTWSIIRNLSSIVIIFFLLYSSILIILGKRESGTVRTIIINVVIAGLLINFSLFFTKVAIDASNIISLALYRAIAPGQVIDFSSPTGYLAASFNDGGLSNVFMNALRIQTHFDASGANGSITFFKVLAEGIGGIALMVIAALSFTVAALLFAIRTGILLILMAFSPIYFVGMIVPKLKEKLSDRWLNSLRNQLLNMPIYFAFMYVAMMVITNKQFQNLINPTTGTAGGSNILSAGTTGAVIQYAIAIVLINIPLIAALMYAGDFSKKWSQLGAQKLNGYLGRTVIGGAAYGLQKSSTYNKFLANNPKLNRFLQLDQGVSKIAGYSFGDKSAKGGFAGAIKKTTEAAEKADKAIFERIGDNVKRENYKTEEEFKTARRIALADQNNQISRLKKSSVFSTVLSKVGIGGDKAAKASAGGLEKKYNAAYGEEYADEIAKARKEAAENVEKAKEDRKTEGQIVQAGVEQHIKMGAFRTEQAQAPLRKKYEQEKMRAEGVLATELKKTNKDIEAYVNEIKNVQRSNQLTPQQKQQMVADLQKEKEALENKATNSKKDAERETKRLSDNLEVALKGVNDRISKQTGIKISELQIKGAQTDQAMFNAEKEKETAKEKVDKELSKYSKAAQKADREANLKKALEGIVDKPEPPAPPTP